jgi:hypothetical protein
MNPPQQDADDELRRAFSEALEAMRALANRLVDTTATEDQVWFQNLLIGIINCALYDHKNVEIGLVKYVPPGRLGHSESTGTQGRD